jgi:3-hydroxy-5-methyl-1-naphthoate 3-O-methyltransferase
MSERSDKKVTPQRLMQYAWGFSVPLAIEAAVENGVFDALAEGAKNLADLEKSTDCSGRGLAALADFLVGIQLLAKDGDGHFRLTEESDTFLVSNKPAFQGGIFRHLSRRIIPGWLGLTEIVRRGYPAMDLSSEPTGAAFFEEFVTDLFPVNYAAAKSLAEGLAREGLPKPASMLDLAAGSGVWGIAAAQVSAAVRVTAVDWPQVLEVTKRVVNRFGLADRFSFSAGDLLEADFGTGHGLATLGHILHTEGEERSRALLVKTFKALAPGGRIAIAEFLVDEDRRGPIPGLIFSINMLVNSRTGRTYSFKEISDWLGAAGFAAPRLMEAPAVSPLILAEKPGS